MKFVSNDSPLPVWTVGYLGSETESVDPFGLAAVEGYEVERRTAETIREGAIDALLVDSRALAASDDALVTAIDGADLPLVVAISRGESVAVPAAALGVVDEHVVIEDAPDRLRSILDEAREQRWSNLGLSAETLLDAVFEAVPIHLYIKDTTACHTRTSSANDTSYDIVGETDREIYSNDRFTTESYRDDLRVIETGEPILDKEEYEDLKETWTLCSKVPLENDGETVGLVGITKQITERKQAQTDLERQIERLEAFASILSHDLRNPLSITLGRAELAHETYPEDEHIESILRNVKRMGTIIDDVLTMTRHGSQVEQIEPVSLRSIAERSWNTVETGDADLMVTAQLRFEGDPDRLDHLFEHLFANSVEHGGGDISVTVEALSDDDGFAVADDGPGVAPEDREQVFERGYSTSSAGTGLGLTIVQQVVEAHDWDLSLVESDDGGVRFVVTGLDTGGGGAHAESVK